jgi:hypothetical protein
MTNTAKTKDIAANGQRGSSPTPPDPVTGCETGAPRSASTGARETDAPTIIVAEIHRRQQGAPRPSERYALALRRLAWVLTHPNPAMEAPAGPEHGFSVWGDDEPIPTPWALHGLKPERDSNHSANCREAEHQRQRAIRHRDGLIVGEQQPHTHEHKRYRSASSAGNNPESTAAFSQRLPGHRVVAHRSNIHGRRDVRSS